MTSFQLHFCLLLISVALLFFAIVRLSCKNPKNNKKAGTTVKSTASPIVNTANTGKIENDKATQERIRRYNDFKTFSEKANAIFNPYKEKNERTKYLQATNMLCICPGGRNGGRDKRVVEVFWGQKLYDQNEQHITGLFQIDHLFYSETGATLSFYKNDNGYVTIYLFPAGTDLTHPEEDGICWKKKVDPSKLLCKSYQKRAWWAFMAYMEVTQLDGRPSLAQRLYIWYLRYFHNLVVDKKWQRTKALDSVNALIKWFPTVALSGIAIFFLQLWFAPNPAEHENIMNVEDTTVEIKNSVDSVNHKLKEIREALDTFRKGHPL